MNDPGFDEPLSQVARETHGSQYDGYASEEEEQREYLESGEWWLASTLGPLLAGTMGPLASAFNICALGSSWRVEFSAFETEDKGQFVEDPRWLVAVNAVSLGFALIANLSLLLNMSGRVPFAIAQPVTCIGFAVAGIILIVLVCLASSPIFRIEPTSEHALSQAFYYAIWAAANYIIIDALMILTVVGAIMGKYERKFYLSNSQRTLMLQTIAFVVYLLVGALIYSRLEGWAYLDAVFWADYTLLTIGIGVPFTPSTHTGRGLLFPYAIGGVITIGLVIGSIRSMILEKGKSKMYARSTEKERERIYSIKKKQGGSYTTRWRRQEKHFIEAGLPTQDRRRKEFHAMRAIQKDAHKRNQRLSLAMSTFAACILWFIGALVFKYTEHDQGWTYFESLYFSYTSLTTIGYGDLSPYSNSGRPFFVLWSILAIPTLTILISDMGDTVIKSIADVTNYIGTLTILPGDDHAYTAMKIRINILTRGHIFKNSEPPRNTFNSKYDKHRTGSFADLVAARLRDEDLFKRRDQFYPQLHEITQNSLDVIADTADNLGIDADTHFYRFLLAKEIRNVLFDMSSATPKKYTYDEWAYFLRLIGHNESNPVKSLHPTPMPRLQSLINGKRKKNGNAPPEIGRIVDTDGNLRQWSWLSIRSPLMSKKEESEWILHALLARLERELMEIPIEPHSRRPHSPQPGSSKRSESLSSNISTQQSAPPVRLSEIDKRLRERDNEDAPHRTASGSELPDDSSQTERATLRRRRSDEEERDAAEAQSSGDEGGQNFAFPVLEAIQARRKGSNGRGQGGASTRKSEPDSG